MHSILESYDLFTVCEKLMANWQSKELATHIGKTNDFESKCFAFLHDEICSENGENNRQNSRSIFLLKC